MRFIHTSDWHLGHTLREFTREGEHAAFLAWLLDRVRDERADALLIAGDVFQTANPSAAAVSMFYQFLVDARRRFPALDVIVIAGNHDSGARLDAAKSVLAALGVHVVGSVPRKADGSIDPAAMLVPITGADGYVAAWVAAVPFLRRADLPAIDGPEPLIAGVRQLYADVIEAARARRWPGQALIAMGHGTITGGVQSIGSERPVLGGERGLPLDVFPDGLAYVALGHLHLAQAVGRPEVRYSGAPIPLNMGESTYEHQILVVDVDGARATSIRTVKTPRTVGLVRLPEGGPRPLGEVLMQLGALEPARADVPAPYLEVRVRLDRPDPAVKRRIDEALAGRHARLVQLTVERVGDDVALADAIAVRDLDQIDPAEVFALRYAQQYGGPPPVELVAAFHELLDAARAEQAA